MALQGLRNRGSVWSLALRAPSSNKGHPWPAVGDTGGIQASDSQYYEVVREATALPRLTHSTKRSSSHGL